MNARFLEQRIASGHALIVGMPNGDGLRATFVMGRYGFGTYGAIRALMSADGWSLRGFDSSSGQKVMAIVRTDAFPASNNEEGPLYASHRSLSKRY